MGLGLKPGDEVITADFTFAATVEVIALLQLTPVLVDVNEDDFNINVEAIKKAITPKTKAIVPVHLFGQCANMEAIMEIAKAHDLFVIEDNAQAIGLAHTIRGIVNHGMYERYHHDVVGVNSRLDSIQAAVLEAKLPHLDAYNKARQKAARTYNEAFKNIERVTTPKTVNGCDGICETCDCHVFHQYTLKIKDINRDALVKHLNDKGIPCGVYYPIPLHKQKAYLDARYQEADFEVTNQLVKTVISLPMHTELDKEQIEYITSTIITFING